MATRVTITGTGTPLHAPGRAGPGVLVETVGGALQFDAGRATTLRLADAGLDLGKLAAVLLTHHHSDHLVGLADLAMTRWLEGDPAGSAGPLRVVAPDGPAADIAEHVLDVWAAEMAMRAAHTGRTATASVDVRRFTPAEEPAPVFAMDGASVSACSVRHEPVIPAVGYRIETADGAVVVSGDTAVCAEVERLADGAEVLVHEAFSAEMLPEGLLSDPEAIAAYHADTMELGAMAARARVRTLVLTHLIPPPATDAERSRFHAEVRRGGFLGTVIVADDLATVTLG